MSNWLEPTTIESGLVKLSPMKPAHRQSLLAAAGDGELWKLWYTNVPSAENIDEYLAFAGKEQSLGRSIPFVVTDKSTQQIIGSTRFCNADPEQRRLEIGYTWYAKTYQRTRVNTECKFLLLRHAFETLNAIAVEFRTHFHNHPSRKAIARLGAKQDGILRNHSIDKKGAIRDTVVFSIIDTEWPAVKQSLLAKLAQKIDRQIQFKNH